MKFEWPAQSSQRFQKEILTATHDLHLLDEFSDAGLAAILDDYPREKLGVYKFPPHSEGIVEAIHGKAPDHSGEELLQAVQKGEIWLNLRAVNQHLERFSPIADAIFDQLQNAGGSRIFKRDVGLLISSPNIHVHYHLDIPVVCLVQIRGKKTIHLYPPKEPFATLSQIEGVVMRERDEEMYFEDSFEKDATVMELSPGDALTWPQNAPHRVQNAGMMNVSLSCEFLTVPAVVRANAHFTNAILRRKLGLNPNLGSSLAPTTIAKAGLARLLKVAMRPPEAAPTPISFELERTSDRS